jgi:hypothetical protein
VFYLCCKLCFCFRPRIVFQAKLNGKGTPLPDIETGLLSLRLQTQTERSEETGDGSPGLLLQAECMKMLPCIDHH